MLFIDMMNVSFSRSFLVRESMLEITGNTHGNLLHGSTTILPSAAQRSTNLSQFPFTGMRYKVFATLKVELFRCWLGAVILALVCQHFQGIWRYVWYRIIILHPEHFLIFGSCSPQELRVCVLTRYDTFGLPVGISSHTHPLKGI